ncbi:MAG: fumarylacetoacetate hydrolase family protein [Chitinophagaceae bacterium]|nr:MAG: fumarylacetoacetate hydrolase family protein [Chitinophagaceae bacterium]
MKLISYQNSVNKPQIAILVDDDVYDLDQLDNSFPATMAEFLNGEEPLMEKAKEYDKKIKSGEIKNITPRNIKELKLLSPVPNPTSCRDAYAFRQHVASARKNRGVDMIPEYDQYPVFYFTNHNAIEGPGEIVCMEDHFHKLDFELEAAIVIGKRGRNVRAEDADQYIAGFTIMNDMSARLLQMEEMKLNLGPAKGKDFSTVIGPWLVTPDELEDFKTSPKKGHTGLALKLGMKCRVNGKQVSEGNLKDMDWTFAEIIERVSYGVDILPGDVIGSGTVGTGCFLELNGTGLRLDKNFKPQWLEDGDEVELEIDGLGILKNTIKKDADDFSILARKKNV